MLLMAMFFMINIIFSDDETVDVAGSEEEETDSEREPSAEATTSYHILSSYYFSTHIICFHFISFHLISYIFTSYHILSSYLFTSYPVNSIFYLFPTFHVILHFRLRILPWSLICQLEDAALNLVGKKYCLSVIIFVCLSVFVFSINKIRSWQYPNVLHIRPGESKEQSRLPERDLQHGLLEAAQGNQRSRNIKFLMLASCTV